MRAATAAANQTRKRLDIASLFLKCYWENSVNCARCERSQIGVRSIYTHLAALLTSSIPKIGIVCLVAEQYIRRRVYTHIAFFFFF